MSVILKIPTNIIRDLKGYVAGAVALWNDVDGSELDKFNFRKVNE